MIVPAARITAILGLLLASVATSALGQEAGPLPSRGAELPGFLAGCWMGTFESSRGPGTIEERFTPPAGGTMLGTTRYVLNEGPTIQFEFHHIGVDSGTVTLLPHPGGRASEHTFRASRVTDSEVVFEAPEHDFPKRILYRRYGRRLDVRVDAGESTNGNEWTLERESCSREP